MADRNFNTTTKIVNLSGDLIREAGCNAIMFTNIGDTICRVNGMVVFPAAAPATLGDSRSFGGHKDEVFTGIIRVQFQQPVGVNPLLEVVQIFYTDVKQ